MNAQTYQCSFTAFHKTLFKIEFVMGKAFRQFCKFQFWSTDTYRSSM